MRRTRYAFVTATVTATATATATATMTLAVMASACSSSPNSGSSAGSAGATTVSSQRTVTTTTGANARLRGLIPTPANTVRTDGPDALEDDGIHTHFLVNGAPNDVMNAFKSALEGQGWVLTVESSGGDGRGGGGTTYTGTNATVYGVFTGGGYGNNTDIDACAWPSKHSTEKCGHGTGH